MFYYLQLHGYIFKRFVDIKCKIIVSRFKKLKRVFIFEIKIKLKQTFYKKIFVSVVFENDHILLPNT